MRCLTLRLFLLAALTSCTGPQPDPERVSERGALDAWRQGQAQLEQGDAEAALAAFDQALEHEPADPLLLAWKARAQARAGDLPSAIATLDTVLGRDPAFHAARYNRAAYKMRAGDARAAAADLRRALEEGARDPREVLFDPDFQPHLDKPEFSFLPKAPLDVELKGPGGSVFVGSNASLRLQVTGLQLDQLEVRAPSLEGPFRLTRVEERRESLPGGDERVSLTWTVRALGAGQTSVGPFTVNAGPRSAQSSADTLLALAPDGHQPPPDRKTDLLVPSALRSTAPSEETIAWRDDSGRLIVRTGAATRVRRTDADPPPPPARASYVQDREEAWGLAWWEDAPQTATVEVKQSGRPVHTGPVE